MKNDDRRLRFSICCLFVLLLDLVGFSGSIVHLVPDRYFPDRIIIIPTNDLKVEVAQEYARNRYASDEF